MTSIRKAQVVRTRGRTRWSWTLLVGLVVAALLAGCTSASTRAAAPNTSPSIRSLNVSNSRGGTMNADGATLVIPAGAVTGQVIAHLKKSSTSVLQAVTPNTRLMLQPVGEAVDVDLSGQQPLRPLTLTLPVAGAGDHPALAIITNHQGTASVLTGTLSADRHSYARLLCLLMAMPEEHWGSWRQLTRREPPARYPSRKVTTGRPRGNPV